MKQLNKLKWTLILINAVLVGAVVFVSALATGSDLIIVLPSAIIAGVLRCIIELQGEIKEELEKLKEKTYKEDIICKKTRSKKTKTGNISMKALLLNHAFFF